MAQSGIRGKHRCLSLLQLMLAVTLHIFTHLRMFLSIFSSHYDFLKDVGQSLRLIDRRKKRGEKKLLWWSCVLPGKAWLNKLSFLYCFYNSQPKMDICNSSHALLIKRTIYLSLSHSHPQLQLSFCASLCCLKVWSICQPCLTAVVYLCVFSSWKWDLNMLRWFFPLRLLTKEEYLPPSL